MGYQRIKNVSSGHRAISTEGFMTKIETNNEEKSVYPYL